MIISKSTNKIPFNILDHFEKNGANRESASTHILDFILENDFIRYEKIYNEFLTYVKNLPVLGKQKYAKNLRFDNMNFEDMPNNVLGLLLYSENITTEEAKKLYKIASIKNIIETKYFDNLVQCSNKLLSGYIANQIDYHFVNNCNSDYYFANRIIEHITKKRNLSHENQALLHYIAKLKNTNNQDCLEEFFIHFYKTEDPVMDILYENINYAMVSKNSQGKIFSILDNFSTKNEEIVNYISNIIVNDYNDMNKDKYHAVIIFCKDKNIHTKIIEKIVNYRKYIAKNDIYKNYSDYIYYDKAQDEIMKVPDSDTAKLLTKLLEENDT
jgi:hypothetical protein